MSEPIYPIDAIGNPLKKGSLVKVELPPESSLLWRVGECSPSRQAGEGNGVVIPGALTLVAQITLQFDPRNPVVTNCLVLKEPEQHRIVVPSGQIKLS